MKFYLISPIGVPQNPHLFPTFYETLISRGHKISHSIEDCDVVLFDLHTRIAGYNQNDIDFIIKNETKIATFDEWDRGGLSSSVWPHPLTAQQYNIFCSIENAVHFSRLLDKTNEYPSNLFPFEKPILYEEPICSADQLFDREHDVCFIANTSPQREGIAKALRADGRLNCNISIGATKIPFNHFVHEHKKAKLFISSSAGGFTDERAQALFSIAGQIKEETDQLRLHDFTHLVNCIKIDSPPSKKQLDTIFEIVSNKGRLYEIYKNGYDFMKTYYSSEYITNNILEIIENSLS